MQDRFQKYRFELIEARNVTRVQLEAGFRHGIISPGAFDNAIEQCLRRAAERQKAHSPWRVQVLALRLIYTCPEAAHRSVALSDNCIDEGPRNF